MGFAKPSSVTFSSGMGNFGAFAASILLFPVLTQAQLPNGACSYEDVTCAITEDNLVGLVEGVSSAGECRLICEESSDSCEFYSYFGPTSFPFTQACLLFSNCTTLDPCNECSTEDIECFFCAAPVEGHLESVLQSCISSQFVFQYFQLQLLNTQKNVQFHLTL